MQLTPLTPFGAAIEGIQLSLVGADQAEALAATIARHRVVVFRDQVINDARFTRFLARLGELTFTEGETPVVGAPMLNIVTNAGRTVPPRSVFHTDTSYVLRPPAFTALRAVTLPGRGGETVFSDQVAAVDRLPLAVRDWLEERTVTHRATGLAGIVEETQQPLLRRHPLTGEVALYLSTPERCVAISGVPTATGARIIRALYRRSTRPTTLYRHSWHPGDVLIWDNRVTMHRADHSATTGDRVLHRGMTLGEVPIAA